MPPSPPVLVFQGPRAPPTPPERAAPRFRDAHHDRVLLLSTGETHPKGTFFASDYEILVAQVGYAVSDTTQLSLTGAPPLGADHIVPLDLTAKTTVVREPTVSVALLASASGLLGVDDVNGFIGRLGGAVTLCQPAWKCRASFTLASNVALLGPASIVFSGVGFVYRFDDRFALLAELDTAVPLGPVVGQANGVLGGAGVRFYGRSYGVDLGLFQPGKAGEHRSPLVPLLVFTWRSAPWSSRR